MGTTRFVVITDLLKRSAPVGTGLPAPSAMTVLDRPRSSPAMMPIRACIVGISVLASKCASRLVRVGRKILDIPLNTSVATTVIALVGVVTVVLV